MRDKIIKELEKLYKLNYLTPEDAKDFLVKLKLYYDTCPEDLKEKLDSGISYCEQELEKYNILLMVAEQQITLKKIVGKFSSSNDLKIRYESDKVPIILIVDIGTFMFNLEYNWKQEIWMSVWHKTKYNNNEETAHPIFPKADDLKPFIFDRIKFVKGKYVLNSSFKSWPKDIELILTNIRNNIPVLTEFLDNNTLRFPDGTMKVIYKKWKSPAVIKGICQESSREFLQGIKKSQQPFYDNSPGLFGSNGTYAGYEERRYYLKYKVIRPSQELYISQTDKVDIESFIRDYYLPKLQRKRMSAILEDEINNKLKTIKIDVVTHDFDEDGAVSADATYLPVGFKSWDEYLRSVF